MGDAWVEGILNVKVTNRGEIFYGISKTKNTAVSPTAQHLNEQIGRTESDVSDKSIAGFGDNVNREIQERYSTRDQTDAVSVREYLSGMKPQPYMNDTEKALLQRYQDKLKDLQEKQQAVAEQDETMAMQGEEQAGENVEKVDESRKVQYAIRDTPAESVTTIAP